MPVIKDRPRWEDVVPTHKCLLCGHEWPVRWSYTRDEPIVPRDCRRCGSTFWNDQVAADYYHETGKKPKYPQSSRVVKNVCVYCGTTFTDKRMRKYCCIDHRSRYYAVKMLDQIPSHSLWPTYWCRWCAKSQRPLFERGHAMMRKTRLHATVVVLECGHVAPPSRITGFGDPPEEERTG